MTFTANPANITCGYGYTYSYQAVFAPTTSTSATPTPVPQTSPATSSDQVINILPTIGGTTTPGPGTYHQANGTTITMTSSTRRRLRIPLLDSIRQLRIRSLVSATVHSRSNRPIPHSAKQHILPHHRQLSLLNQPSDHNLRIRLHLQLPSSLCPSKLHSSSDPNLNTNTYPTSSNHSDKSCHSRPWNNDSASNCNSNSNTSSRDANPNSSPRRYQLHIHG